MTLKSILLAATFFGFATSQSSAEGNAGAYLSARQASVLADYDAAASHYARALVFDPTNPFLMESAIASYIGAGEIEKALPIAIVLSTSDTVSQLGDLVFTTGLVQAADYQTVIEQIEAGHEIGPLVDGLLQAWSHVGLGDMTTALTLFDEVTVAPGLRSFGLYHKALALASVGDFEGADVIFSNMQTRGGLRTRRGALAHAQVLSQLDRNEDAVLLMDRIFGSNLGPDLEPIRAALAAGAPLEFTTVRTPREGVAEIFYSVAGALDGEMEDDFTLIYSRVAEFLRRDHIEAILLSARLLDSLEQFDLATETYDRVPRDDPAFHAAELGRAAALNSAGRYDAAVEVLTQLTESHGEMVQVHRALGDAFRRLDRLEEANASYSQALDLVDAPQKVHWFLFYSRGITFERMGNWPEAEADFRAALSLNPGQPQVLNYLGYSLVVKGLKLNEALGMIEKAAAARPDAGYIIDSLGWVLFRIDRFEEAVFHLERAAALEPVDPIVNDHLGDAYWAVGRENEARFQWSRAMSFDPEKKDADRIRRKLEFGLDQVLIEEGQDPIQVANDDS